MTCGYSIDSELFYASDIVRTIFASAEVSALRIMYDILSEVKGTFHEFVQKTTEFCGECWI